VADLLGLWMQRDSFELFRQAKHLVANKLVELEARRLSISLDAELAEKRYKESVADIEKSLAKDRPGIKLDDFVSRVLGLDPLRYRERLRTDAARGVLAERCVRAYLLENEHAELRLIAVQSEDALKKVQAALASGAEFAAVAKENSVDPSSKQGGRMSGVVKSNSIMGRLAFNTPVGSVSAPEYAQGVWLLIKVEGRPAPITGGWKELRSAVEASLADWKIDDVEYKQWETAMGERYSVDLAPLLALSGQVAR
jgi:parvulin-like peptidyl-prolyl isomerase